MGIRKATYNETQIILGYAPAIVEESTMGHVKPGEENTLPMMSPVLAEGGYYLIYIEKNVLQGWVGVGGTYDIYKNKEVGMIPEIYVLPPYRKQGIAEKLCNEALNQLKEAGYRTVQLNVFSGNNAKHLYEKLGFYEVSSLMERDLHDNEKGI